MADVITDPKRIEELLSRGVSEAIDREQLATLLASGKQLRIKLGIDPTSPNLHLGRSIPLLKLRDFQELGHQIVFIIGDFTGTIGDTSDKDAERPMLDLETVRTNMATYIAQAGRIINIDATEIVHNSEWLGKLGFAEIGHLADQFSINEFISRENIAKRLDSGKRVSLREVLYPLMQGYDSVEIKADVEVGGTDQRFNLLAGRELQRAAGQPAQHIVMNPLIAGLDGRKMSSSWGNTVNLTDTSNDMFGKIMSLNDELIIPYFVNVTRVPMEAVAAHEAALTGGANPRDVKIALAHAITQFYHGTDAANAASDYFRTTISEHQLPTEMPEFAPSAYDIQSVLIDTGTASSKSEVRRLLEQNGIKVNQQVITDPVHVCKPGDVIQRGKLTFLKLK